MILVVDVGTTGLRAAIVDHDGEIRATEYRRCAPSSPLPGLVEFDATTMAATVVDASRSVLARLGDPPLSCIGIATQRASTIVWDRTSGEPVGPALGWQDLRTVGDCIAATAEHGVTLAPNQTATKAARILSDSGADVDSVCIGTVDSWVAWVLSGGESHITDHTNAAVTGLYSLETGTWDARVCDLLGIPVSALPTIVDSAGRLGTARVLPGSPPISGIIGDQQGSLIGQGCLTPGEAKITFGTGAMLDMCTGDSPPASGRRTVDGTFPVVAWSIGGERSWGTEAIMLSAGSNIEWLHEDLGLISDPADSHTVASRCEQADGVVYVPALLGLGTPSWDYGARGTMLGITRGTSRPHIVRAVLEGIAHRGADLIDAAEADSGLTIPLLRIDGGMSRNPTFVRALADAADKPVAVSPVIEATTLGAAYLAGVGRGIWRDLTEACASGAPPGRVEPAPGDRDRQRAQWRRAVARAENWIPELSALDF